MKALCVHASSRAGLVCSDGVGGSASRAALRQPAFHPLPPCLQALKEEEALLGAAATQPRCPRLVVVVPTAELCAQVCYRTLVGLAGLRVCERTAPPTSRMQCSQRSVLCCWSRFASPQCTLPASAVPQPRCCACAVHCPGSEACASAQQQPRAGGLCARSVRRLKTG